ncbi:MAG TPA: hypothetical protein VGL09_22825 [Methylomirabilota bacterium]
MTPERHGLGDLADLVTDERAMTVADVNALPLDVREAIYARLVPPELLARFAASSLLRHDAAGACITRVTAPPDASWARVEFRAATDDRDPVLLIDVGMSPFGVPELSLVQVNDPEAPRYAIDQDEDGQDTLLGTAFRNHAEELRALKDGLAPGQVRRGLRMLGRVLDSVDDFCRLLGRECYLVEPLFYHSAILYERRGCGYLLGREIMEEIHAGFEPGGPLARRLDDSTSFRRREFAATARGRSWAIHDGILGAAWSGVKMYRVPGVPAGVSTFPGATY